MTEVKSLPISSIVESKTNPRRHFDEKTLKELAASIKSTNGVLNPILVRQINGKYEIVAGARRFRASKLAGITEILASVRDLSDEKVLEIQVVENLQREDVHPLDEALGYEQLMKKHGYDVETVANVASKSVSYVYQRLKLAELIEPARKAFFEGELTAGHAIILARLQPKDQEKALKECFVTRWKVPGRIAISVRELWKWIEENIHLDLHSVPFPKDDANLVPKAGACKLCPKRSGFNQDLFNDIQKKDVCTDPVCFKAKLAAFFDARKKEAKEKFGQEPILISGQSNSWESRKRLPTRDEWKEVGKKNECTHAKAAVIAEGNGTGRILKVCIEGKCKKHFPESASGRQRQESAASIKRRLEQERKRAIDERVQEEIYKILPKHVPNDIKIPELIMLVQLLGDASDVDQSEYQRMLGLKGNISNHSGPQLCRLINLTMLDPQFIEYTGRSEWLFKSAKRWGVKVEKIRKTVLERVKWKCEGCSCTELKACEGGCSWDETFAKQRRHVCSKCTKKVPAKMQTSAKTKRAGKKGRKS